MAETFKPLTRNELRYFGSLDTLTNIFPNPTIALNRLIYWTLKEDGSNLCYWRRHPDDADEMISSRTKNSLTAEPGMQRDARSTEAHPHLIHILEDFPNYYLFGELLRTKKNGQPAGSPTGLKMYDKNEFIGFDIHDFDRTSPLNPKGRLPTYEALSLFDEYDVPRVMVIETGTYKTVEELFEANDRLLKEMFDSVEEGVVAKSADNLIRWKARSHIHYSKERKSQRRGKKDDGRPKLPEDEAFGAVDKVYAELGYDQFTGGVKFVMPLVAQAINDEVSKHGTGPPYNNYYYYYTEYLKRILIDRNKEE